MDTNLTSECQEHQSIREDRDRLRAEVERLKDRSARDDDRRAVAERTLSRAVALLGEAYDEIKSFCKDIETFTGEGYGNLHPNDFRASHLAALTPRIDALLSEMKNTEEPSQRQASPETSVDVATDSRGGSSSPDHGQSPCEGSDGLRPASPAPERCPTCGGPFVPRRYLDTSRYGYCTDKYHDTPSEPPAPERCEHPSDARPVEASPRRCPTCAAEPDMEVGMMRGGWKCTDPWHDTPSEVSPTEGRANPEGTAFVEE